MYTNKDECWGKLIFNTAYQMMLFLIGCFQT
jgi:hypothetical protein